MSLENEKHLNENQDVFHPHIDEDGTITSEGKRFVLDEFEKRKGINCPDAINFYNQLEPQAKEIIYKKYGFEIMNMHSCKMCSHYFR